MLVQGKKIYFASDLHLGAPNHELSKKREKAFVNWLKMIENDAQELYIVGDVFDFWFEYGTVIPKGYLNLFATLLRLREQGIIITMLSGNHDMWMRNYFMEELGIPVFHDPIIRTWNGHKFYIGHGDGLGPGDHRYKFLKKIFRNPSCRWAFKWLHPDIGMSIASYWSKRSRKSQLETEEIFLGADKEWLYIFAQEMLDKEHFDFFIFGHRHLPLNLKLNERSLYINLGDWIKHNSYGQYDGHTMEIKYFSPDIIRGNDLISSGQASS